MRVLVMLLLALMAISLWCAANQFKDADTDAKRQQILLDASAYGSW